MMRASVSSSSFIPLQSSTHISSSSRTLLSRILLCLSIVLALMQGSAALFKDQAGKWDWRQSYVGRVKFMESDATQAGIKRVFVATQDNAVAAINARTGHFFWRHLYEDDEGGSILAILGGSKSFTSGLISVSGSVDSLFRVRSWSKEKGHLMWEVVLPIQDGLRASMKTSEFVGALFVAGNDYTKQVVVVFEHALYVLNIDTGVLGWTHEFGADEKPVDAEAVGSGEQFIVASAMGKINVKTFDSLTGDVDDEAELSSDWLSSSSSATNCALDASRILCFDQENMLLRHAILGKQARFSATPMDILYPSLATSAVSSISPLISSLGVFQLTFSSGQRLIVKVDSASGVTSVGAVVSAPSAAAIIGDNHILFRIEVDAAASKPSYRLKFVDVASGEEKKDLEQSIDLSGWRGGVQQILGVVFSSKRDTGLTFRIFAAMEDHSIALVIPPGHAAWVREEALASILSVVMLELPVSKVQAQLFQDQSGGEKKNQNVATAFINRISLQAEQFVSFMYYLQDKFRVRLPPPRDENGNHIRRESSSSSSSSSTPSHDLFSPLPPPDLELVRDSFGLRKIIVVSTAAKKLIALDSETGFVIWRKFLADVESFKLPASAAGAPKPSFKHVSPLYALRSSAHVPRTPLCLLVGKSPSSEEGVIFEFDPLTGESSSSPAGVVHLGFKIKQASLLDASFPRTADHVRGVVILDDELGVHVHPASLKPKLVDRVSSHFVFAADAVKGTIEGFSIHPGNQLEWKAKRVWNVKVPVRLGSITTVVGRPPGEQTHSQGRVLADRSVMYKYLNPNLVAIVAEGEDDSVSCEGTSSFQCFKGQLSIFLLDVITGHMVFTTTHKKCTGPVNIVHSENWLVYSYWNQRHRRNEIASIELYEGKTQSNTTTFSSIDLPLVSPMVERQAFIFPSSIQALGVSVTEKGISNKDLLISLATGGLLELPRMFLDPRRPVEPRPEDREEGLIPYTPELPVPPIGIVSYNQTVSRARGVATSPAGLESTSLVLVHGMDLFFTRIHPSKMFDVLKDDFDYLFISSVLFGLIAASFVFQQLAVNKTIKRAWR